MELQEQIDNLERELTREYIANSSFEYQIALEEEIEKLKKLQQRKG